MPLLLHIARDIVAVAQALLDASQRTPRATHSGLRAAASACPSRCRRPGCPSPMGLQAADTPRHCAPRGLCAGNAREARVGSRVGAGVAARSAERCRGPKWHSLKPQPGKNHVSTPQWEPRYGGSAMPGYEESTSKIDGYASAHVSRKEGVG